MDLDRAKELMKAEKDYEVTFDGINIVIDDLFELTKMARVHERNNTAKNQVVPLVHLIEKEQIS